MKEQNKSDAHVSNCGNKNCNSSEYFCFILVQMY